MTRAHGKGQRAANSARAPSGSSTPKLKRGKSPQGRLARHVRCSKQAAHGQTTARLRVCTDAARSSGPSAWSATPTRVRTCKVVVTQQVKAQKACVWVKERGRVIPLIALGSSYVRCTQMGRTRTCGGPNDIDLSTINALLDGLLHVRLRVASALRAVSLVVEGVGLEEEDLPSRLLLQYQVLRHTQRTKQSRERCMPVADLIDPRSPK